MTAPHIIDPVGMLGQALSQASDLMRFLAPARRRVAISGQPDTVPGAQWGQQDPQRHAQHGCATGLDPPGLARLTWLSPSCSRTTKWTSLAANALAALITVVAEECRRTVWTARENLGDHRTIQVPGLTQQQTLNERVATGLHVRAVRVRCR